MDVQLPDGRVIKGVPDGTTKDQLSQKLKSNRIDFGSSPKKEEGGFLGGSEAWHNFAKDEPGHTYGDILPYDKDNKTGAVMPALPEMIRSPIRGIGDLLELSETKTPGSSPDAVNAMLAMAPAGKAASNLVENSADLLAPAVNSVKNAVTSPIKTASKAINSAGGAVKPLVQPVVRNIIENDNPITGEPGLKKALESDTSKEGQRLGKKLGVNFSAGELTGNPTAMGIEDALANSARHGGKFEEENSKKVNAIIGEYKKTLDQVYPSATSRTDVGDKIAESYKKTIEGLKTLRRTNADADFNAAYAEAGSKPSIPANNFISTLKNYIAEGDSPTATPAQKAASSQAREMLNNLRQEQPKKSLILDQDGNPIQPTPVEDYKKITVKDLQNGLAAYGEGAYSGGGIWKNLDTASDRRFSQAAKAALQKDLDVAADSQPAGSALKKARDNYNRISQTISDIRNTSIGKAVGSAQLDSKGNLVISPEKMADKFYSMEPTELKNTLAFLDKTSPEVANMARRSYLEKAWQKAQEGKGQRGQGTTKNFAKGEFVDNLPSPEKLNALLGDSKAAADIKDIASAMNRMIDYGASQSGSQTAMRQNFLERIAHWGKGAMYKSLVSDTLAEDLLNPAKRMQIWKDAEKINSEKVPENEANQAIGASNEIP